ncbi:MAG: UBP-type zinc finger domain-containing protein [Polyangiaceae bacterium]|nr:UBP-type zinc finger domain-containing protein [Polyangiaceae bacterium]
MRNKRGSCPHYNGEPSTAPATPHCAECGSTSSLRVCVTCGHVGCCESQKGHNTAHAKAAGHPIIKSLPLGEHSFTWCYTCNSYV